MPQVVKRLRRQLNEATRVNEQLRAECSAQSARMEVGGGPGGLARRRRSLRLPQSWTSRLRALEARAESHKREKEGLEDRIVVRATAKRVETGRCGSVPHLLLTPRPARPACVTPAVVAATACIVPARRCGPPQGSRGPHARGGTCGRGTPCCPCHSRRCPPCLAGAPAAWGRVVLKYGISLVCRAIHSTVLPRSASAPCWPRKQ